MAARKKRVARKGRGADGSKSKIQVITDPTAVASSRQKPQISFTTGIGETFHIKVNQPSGRALLIAVHL